jgi:glycosyltransferase involved in cell wall biosynthesis
MGKVVYELQTMAELLSLRGHNVYALSYDSMWQRDEPTLSNQTVARVYPSAKVHLIQPEFIKVPVLSRISAFVTHYYAIKKAIQEHGIDVIILYSVPTNGLQTVQLAKKFGVPVIFRSIDTLHALVRNRLLSKITYQMEKFVYSKSDVTIAINKGLMRYVSKLGAKDVRLLPLGVDTNLYCPKPQSKWLRDKWGIGGDDRLIVFVGTLPRFSGLDALIREFTEMSWRIPDIKLLIVGDGEQRSDLDKLIRDTGLSGRVIITGYRPQEEIPDYINIADVCVITFPVVAATRDIFPTKVIQYMACGKPVVSTRLPGLMEAIPEHLKVVMYNDHLFKEIVSLLESRWKSKRVSEWAVDYVEQNYSYDSVISRLEEIMEEVTNDRR